MTLTNIGTKFQLSRMVAKKVIFLAKFGTSGQNGRFLLTNIATKFQLSRMVAKKHIFLAKFGTLGQIKCFLSWQMTSLINEIF